MTRKSRKSRNRAAVTVKFPLLSWLSASSLIRMPCAAWLLAKKLACSWFCRCSAVSYSFFTIGCWVSACSYRLLVGLAGRGELSVALLDLPLDVVDLRLRRVTSCEAAL